jgi:hypothetical protein
MLVPAVFAFLMAAQAPVSPAPAQPAAQTVTAHVPAVGDVEIFGARKVTRERILKALGTKPGEAMPPSKTQLEEALLALDGVARATVEAVCCEGGGAILYVGIEEKGQPGFALRDWPRNDIHLPDEMIDAYHDFTVALGEAVRHGDTHEDVSAGHSMMDNIACHMYQSRFLGFAEAYSEVLHAVVREADDEEERAVAAYVMGYAPRKQDVTDDLQLALRDPDPGVRANALRALRPIVELSLKDPARGIRVEPTWFVEMLNSTVLADKINGAKMLLTMSEGGVPETMAAHIRERGMASLEEMAHWHRLENALPAYLLLGRLAGIGDAELEAAWAGPDREAKLQEIDKKLKSKK